MSGHGAILVLERARAKAGDPKFLGSRAEAIRLASIDLDEDHSDAVRLVGLIPSCAHTDVLLRRLEDQPPLQRAAMRRRMCEDFTTAIQKLLTVADSIRKRRGVLAAREAQNWANAKKTPEERDKEWSRTFADVHADVSRKVAA